MFPLINKRETGINLRRIMHMRGFSAKDLQDQHIYIKFSYHNEQVNVLWLEKTAKIRYNFYPQASFAGFVGRTPQISTKQKNQTTKEI